MVSRSGQNSTVVPLLLDPVPSIFSHMGETYSVRYTVSTAFVDCQDRGSCSATVGGCESESDDSLCHSQPARAALSLP